MLRENGKRSASRSSRPGPDAQHKAPTQRVRGVASTTSAQRQPHPRLRQPRSRQEREAFRPPAGCPPTPPHYQEAAGDESRRSPTRRQPGTPVLEGTQTEASASGSAEIRSSPSSASSSRLAVPRAVGSRRCASIPEPLALGDRDGVPPLDRLERDLGDRLAQHALERRPADLLLPGPATAALRRASGSPRAPSARVLVLNTWVKRSPPPPPSADTRPPARHVVWILDHLPDALLVGGQRAVPWTFGILSSGSRSARTRRAGPGARARPGSSARPGTRSRRSLAPRLATSSHTARAVPPVASRSSCTSTRAPPRSASAWTSSASVPYSRRTRRPPSRAGSFPGLRAGTKPAPSCRASAAPRMKPRASAATTSRRRAPRRARPAPKPRGRLRGGRAAAG